MKTRFFTSMPVVTAIMAAGALLTLAGRVAADEGEIDPPPSVVKAGDMDQAAALPAAQPQEEAQDSDQESAQAQQPFSILDAQVPAGETRRLSWVASESFTGLSVPTPVLVAHGVGPGPTLCLTAAVHGDELNGIEMVRRVLYGLDPEKLNGTVVGVPIVNLLGFRRASRYLPDRRDLNRYFPGDPHGSSASRIAYAFFESVIRHCDALVDLHTGSFHRTNLPQLRADLDNPEVVELTQGFGATAVLHTKGQRGTLRRAATQAGVPAVTLEAGEPKRFQPEEVEHGVKGIRTLLHKMGMVKHISLWGEPQPVYYESDWVRADTGGILFSRVELGQTVDKNAVLGTVTDPITNKRSKIRSPEAGRVLGMALNQVVIPGFAAYRIGIEKSSEEISEQIEGQTGGDQAAAAAEAPPPSQDEQPTTDATEQPEDADVKEQQERPD